MHDSVVSLPCLIQCLTKTCVKSRQASSSDEFRLVSSPKKMVLKSAGAACDAVVCLVALYATGLPGTKCTRSCKIYG